MAMRGDRRVSCVGGPFPRGVMVVVAVQEASYIDLIYSEVPVKIVGRKNNYMRHGMTLHLTIHHHVPQAIGLRGR